MLSKLILLCVTIRENLISVVLSKNVLLSACVFASVLHSYLPMNVLVSAHFISRSGTSVIELHSV